MSCAARPLGPEFWAGAPVAGALARCDFPVLLEAVRRAQGWSQSELAGVAGYSQSWVSRVIRGQQSLTLGQAREIAVRVGIPVHLLRLGSEGGDDPARRRDFGKAAALALVPWPALPGSDQSAASALTTITAAQRRLDATTPARELARSATVHVETASRVLGRTAGPGSADVAAAVSEAAGFAGWLHADMCDHGTARTYYRLAAGSARQAGHDLLAGYMLGSLATFEIDNGDPVTGLGLVSKAREQITASCHHAPQAWLAAIAALGHATAGNAPAADAAIGLAGRIVDASDPDEAPPWPWLFAFDHAKLAGYRALACVRLGRAEAALAAFARSLGSAQPAPKQRAVLSLERQRHARTAPSAMTPPGSMRRSAWRRGRLKQAGSTGLSG